MTYERHVGFEVNRDLVEFEKIAAMAKAFAIAQGQPLSDEDVDTIAETPEQARQIKEDIAQQRVAMEVSRRSRGSPDSDWGDMRPPHGGQGPPFSMGW